jgi:hypothetical protein
VQLLDVCARSGIFFRMVAQFRLNLVGCLLDHFPYQIRFGPVRGLEFERTVSDAVSNKVNKNSRGISGRDQTSNASSVSFSDRVTRVE